MQPLANIRFDISTWPMIMAKIEPGAKVSKIILSAAEDFALQTGKDPAYAFVREIPTGAEEFVELKKITLIRAAWVPDGHVAVCRGGMQVFDEEYRKWIKK
ncbi:MAG TPA: hypothetical protein DCG54_07530 [Anaerolineae bacterium]|jgi:hypothetical protein|nr:hypothetical protein [Anaerolineae bacterium]